jgi:hypothetical protein
MTISIKNETIFVAFVLRQHWYHEDIREVKYLHKIGNAFCLWILVLKGIIFLQKTENNHNNNDYTSS